MIRLTSITLATLIFLQSVSIKPADLMDLDVFASHAIDHIKQGNSFVEFLSMHYGNKAKEHIPNRSEHKNLPFKNLADFSILNIFTLTNCNYHLSKKEYSTLDLKSKYYYINLYSFIFLKKFIQPPSHY